MKITFLVLGKTEDSYLKEGIEKYTKRLKHYIKFEKIHVRLPSFRFPIRVYKDSKEDKETRLSAKWIGYQAIIRLHKRITCLR